MSTLVQESVQTLQPAVVERKRHQSYANGNGSLEQSDDTAKFFEPVPPSKDGMRVSEEEYWETYYHDLDYYYEWNNGILEEKPVSTILGADQLRWVVGVAEASIQTNPIARLVNLEVGFRMEVQDGTTIRRPDLFVVCNDNPVPAHAHDLTYQGTPDICFEALSSSTQSGITRDVTNKRGEYERAGVREYYILDPDGEHTAFYRRNAQGHYEEIPVGADGIVRSTVLPGFQFRERILYRMPSLLAMAQDEVYRDFVMPAYHQERERAEQERLRAIEADARAEQERLRAIEADARAEQERLRAIEADARAAEANARAEQFATQLRALGLLKE